MIRGGAHEGLAIFALVVCTIVMVACASSARGVPQQGGGAVTQVASNAEGFLVPIREAGVGGWCVTTRRLGGGEVCPTFGMPSRFGPFSGPIVIENWSGRSFSSESSAEAVDEALVLTTSVVAGVSLEGGVRVATRAESVLPDALRAAVVELRGGSGAQVLGTPVPPAFPRAHFEAFGSDGKVLAQTRALAPPLEFRAPSKSWRATQPPARGICGLTVKDFRGLVSAGGSVMTSIMPHRDTLGRELVDCERSMYSLGGTRLEADVLLDAEHPGGRRPRCQRLSRCEDGLIRS